MERRVNILPMIKLAMLITFGMGSLYAQGGLRGHWTGGEQFPGRDPITVELDFDAGPAGWVGSLSIPVQNVSGIPLELITTTGRECSFRVKGMPNDPTYKGTLSEDGKVIEGEYTEGTLKVPFKFTLIGEPTLEIPKTSPNVSQAFVGDWEGTLKLGNGNRVILRISNDQSGASALLISVDEGNGQIPVTSIEQQGSGLTLVLKPLGGSRYTAEISPDGTALNGTLALGDNNVPLNFKKASAAVQKN